MILDKGGIGTAINTQSRGLSHGLSMRSLPSIDGANTRDFDFLITDGTSFFSEEERGAHHEVAMLGPGIPAYRLTNTWSEVEPQECARPYQAPFERMTTISTIKLLRLCRC